MYLSILKEKLLEGEFIVIGDVAKNCGFLVQDAAEGFHWNNMAVHTFQRKLLAHLNSLFTISSVIYIFLMEQHHNAKTEKI